MADAKIINYGQPIGAGTTAIPDNHATALDIEGVDGKDYINISTVDGSEIITIKAGGNSIQDVQIDAGGHVSGSSGQYSLRAATATATVPTFAFSGDNDTGIGKAAADQLSLIAGGVECLRLTAGGVSKPFGTQGGGTVGTGGSSDATLEQSGASTFQTALHVGAAIKIVDSGDGEVFLRTVASITDANTLEMDEAAVVENGSAWHHDSGELFAVKTGDSKTLFGVNETGAIQAGTSAADSEGSNNIAIGDSDALDLLSQQVSTLNGTRNYIIGHASDNYKVTTGYRNIFLGYGAGEDVTTGGYNILLGDSAGTSLSTSSQNTLIGASAGLLVTGADNTTLGFQAGNTISSGAENISIGSGSDCAATLDNQVAIGYGAVTAAANQVRLGNTSVDDIDGQVALTATSDSRIKTNVQDLTAGLDFINALRPVSFTRVHPAEWPEEIRDRRYKEGRTLVDADGNETIVSTPSFDVDTQQPVKDGFDSTTRSDGLLAQEVQAACESLGVTFSGIKQSPNGKMGIQYSLLVAPLIKAVQELTARVAELEAGD